MSRIQVDTDVIETYLTHLSQAVPTTTYQSHQTTLRQFDRWCHAREQDFSITTNTISDFALHLFTEYSPSTARGHLDTLANFIAYLRIEDPKLVKLRIITNLRHKSTTNTVNSSEALAVARCETLHPPLIDETTRNGVEILLAYLRTHRFGTIAHALAEVIVESTGSITAIRTCDLAAFDRTSGTLEISISDEHAVSQAGLVETRPCSLPKRTIDALTTYIDENRTGSTAQSAPLFTTTHGRVSRSTVRRAVKDANGSTASVVDSHSSQVSCAVTPKDLRRYAYEQLLLQ